MAHEKAKGRGFATLWAAGLCGAFSLAAPAFAEPPEVGRVVAVHGSVTAEAPGDAPRLLQCNDPIFAGDRIVTADGARLGVLSGEFYAGLNEKSTLGFATTSAGAPDLNLAAGHVRLFDPADNPRGQIATPGLLTRAADKDTEAFAFPEKAGVLSMICPWEKGIEVERIGKPDERALTGGGKCAVAKPREPLYLADASHPKLGVLSHGCPELHVAGGPLLRFQPGDVALAPPSLATGPEISGHFDDPRLPCDLPSQCPAPNTPTAPGGPPSP